MLKAELVQAIFKTDDRLLLEGQCMKRINLGNRRFYYHDGHTFASSTTFVSSCMPEQRYLTSWREQKAAELGSQEKAQELVQSMADYGTLLHIAVGDYCREGKVDTNTLENFFYTELTESYKFSHKLAVSATRQLKKDFAAILQFIYDYNVEVKAVELPVFFHTHEVMRDPIPSVNRGGVATQIDFLVEMDAMNYQKTEDEKRKRITAIINLKSGSSVFESHLYQIMAERDAFNCRFGELFGKVQHIYNLAPKRWQTTPTYKLTNRTEQAIEKKRQYYAMLMFGDAENILSAPVKPLYDIKGTLQLGKNPSDLVQEIHYGEYIEQLPIQETTDIKLSDYDIF